MHRGESVTTVKLHYHGNKLTLGGIELAAIFNGGPSVNALFVRLLLFLSLSCFCPLLLL